ncbi:hypothetical protein ALC62_11123, partial [Cyphomyrmex costatus]
CREYVIVAICSYVTCSGSSRVKSSDPASSLLPLAPPAHNLFLRFSLSLRDFLLLRLYPPVLSAVA